MSKTKDKIDKPTRVAAGWVVLGLGVSVLGLWIAGWLLLPGVTSVIAVVLGGLVVATFSGNLILSGIDSIMGDEDE